jgi:glycosyltransferase involved in cell wall biosynthesis
VAWTVLSVAYPLAPVGPDAVGGAEQVLWSLDRALVAGGHRSIVIGCAGSRVFGELVDTGALLGPIDDSLRRQAQQSARDAVAGVVERHSVDVVHMHGLDFDAYLPPPGPPVLATLHLPPAWFSARALAPERPRTYLNCVSSSQHRSMPPTAPVVAEVPNGVSVGLFNGPKRRRTYALWLGRICPEKGVHLAIDAARVARAPLLVAGRTFAYETHERYYRDEVAPRLDAFRRYVGPVGPSAKRRLLGAARCLLVPSLAPETSSLVAMEALASGTPVVAFPSGALPEIIEHGRTGYLVRDVAEMAAAIEAAGDLDPEVCRHVARQRFSGGRMAARYLQLYETLTRCSPPTLPLQPSSLS